MTNKTIKDWVVNYCFERGMFEDQALAVFEAVKASPANEAMEGRWNDPVDGYHQAILNVLALSVKQEAVTWIEKNLPKAWYKPMFV